MDAFRIAFRLPNVLRDLFAEGALSAAFVPTFTRALATGDRAAAWRLASNVITVLLLISGAVIVAGILFADPLVRLYAAGVSRRAWKNRAHHPPHAHHVPVSRDGGHGRRDDGDAQRAASLLHTRALARDVQRRHHHLRNHRRAAVAAPGNPAHRRDCRRHAHRRRGTDPAAMAGVAARGLSLSAGLRRARSVAARDRALDGAGRGRAGGGADQPAGQQLARGRAGNRRGLVARLCVPPDVHADWPVRRLHRDGLAADNLRARGRPQRSGSPARSLERAANDADAERASDGRAAGAGDARSSG